jgi:primosomal protein N' (replication factor Y)
LAALIVSGMERGPTQSFATSIRRAAPEDATVMVLGPAEAPLAVVRGRHRYRLLVQAPRTTNLQAYLRDWLSAAPRPRGDLRVQVDIDPQSFL